MRVINFTFLFARVYGLTPAEFAEIEFSEGSIAVMGCNLKV